MAILLKFGFAGKKYSLFPVIFFKIFFVGGCSTSEIPCESGGITGKCGAIGAGFQGIFETVCITPRESPNLHQSTLVRVGQSSNVSVESPIIMRDGPSLLGD